MKYVKLRSSFGAEASASDEVNGGVDSPAIRCLDRSTY